MATRSILLGVWLAADSVSWPGDGFAQPGSRSPGPIDPVERPAPRSAAASIGTATILADGTILLHLRADGPEGSVGDALLRYLPSDPRYQAVRDHLPGLRPGATIPVPPFE